MGLRKHEGQGCILADEMYASLSLVLPEALTFLQGHGQDIAGEWISEH